MARYAVRPEILDAQAQIESGGDPKAVSKKGARGLHQIMPETWNQYGKGNPFNAQDSRRAAENYLSDLLDQFHGDEAKALAAYNGGPNRLAKLNGDISQMPAESQNYVSKIASALNPISSSSAGEMPEQGKTKIARIKLPDGRIAKFKVPADYTPEQAISEANNYFESQQPQSESVQQEQTPQEPSPAEQISSGIDRAAWLAGRAGIEGVASIPGGVYNFASTLSHLPEIIKGKEIHAKNEWGVPSNIDTQQYGTKLADLIGLPKENALEKIPMDMARTGAGWLAGGAVLKSGMKLGELAKLIGADKPLLSAISAAAGTGASEVTRDSGGNVPTQIAAGILANMMVGGGARLGSYAIKPSERGAGALERAVKNSQLPEEMKSIILTDSPGEFIKEAKPTAAMKYSNPIIADAETQARLRNKGAFFARDEANQRAAFDEIKAKSQGDSKQLLRHLNSSTTPLREDAIIAARNTGGYEAPLEQKINELRTLPGTRFDKKLDPLLKPAEDILSAQHDPLDIYTYRKSLADSLNNKAVLTMDEMTNAAKSSRREATLLKNAVDKGLNDSSGGKWEAYIAAHREGMKPINELEAWQEVLNRFNKAPEIAPGIPRITPAALRSGIQGKTFSKSGRDLLSGEGRNLADQLTNTLNALERARDPRGAISGSQTTPLLMQASKSILANKPGIKNFIDLMKGASGYFTGNNALDDALLNPEKLQKLIDTAIKNKDSSFLKSLRDAAIRAESSANKNEK